MQNLRRLHRIAVLFLCLSLFSSIGGHWVVLQSVAWAQMLGTFARTESIQTAAVKTFDGKHPCEICKKIVRAKAKEKTNVIVLKSQQVKVHFTEVSVLHRPFAVNGAPITSFLGLGFGILAVSPPTPPPQA